MGSAAVRVTGQPDKTTAAAGPGGEADVRDATRSGVRVDPGGEEHEGHDDVRSVTSGLAGVEIDRSGPRGFGMAAVGRSSRPARAKRMTRVCSITAPYSPSDLSGSCTGRAWWGRCNRTVLAPNPFQLVTNLLSAEFHRRARPILHLPN